MFSLNSLFNKEEIILVNFLLAITKIQSFISIIRP